MKYALYDFDLNRMATEQVFDDYQDAADLANCYNNVIVISFEADGIVVDGDESEAELDPELQGIIDAALNQAADQRASLMMNDVLKQLKQKNEDE